MWGRFLGTYFFGGAQTEFCHDGVKVAVGQGFKSGTKLLEPFLHEFFCSSLSGIIGAPAFFDNTNIVCINTSNITQTKYSDIGNSEAIIALASQASFTNMRLSLLAGGVVCSSDTCRACTALTGE